MRLRREVRASARHAAATGNCRADHGFDDRHRSLRPQRNLVTHNTADFQFIPGLRLDDWLT